MDFQDSRTKEVLSAEIHCYEFFHLVIDLLRSLCGAEPNGISAVATNISLQSVNFALENLCTLQFGGSTNVSLVTAQVAELKAAMTHLLLVALQKVSESFHNTPCYIDSVTALKYVYLKTMSSSLVVVATFVTQRHEHFLFLEFLFHKGIHDN
jgi:hypothetical protein